MDSTKNIPVLSEQEYKKKTWKLKKKLKCFY